MAGLNWGYLPTPLNIFILRINYSARFIISTRRLMKVMYSNNETFYDYSRYTLSYLQNNIEEKHSITAEHLERLNSGVIFWNEWNNQFLKYIEENHITDPVIILSETQINLRDLNGYNFACNVSFSHATYSGHASFRETTFLGYADFSKTTFLDFSDFRGATFLGYVDFSETMFLDYASFSEVTFSVDADFRGATFSVDADFKETTFSGYADFRETTFLDYTSFNETIFLDYASFSEVTFSGDSEFREVKFSGDVSFSRATFLGNAYFRETSFSTDVSFGEATFFCDADFINGTFGSTISFEDVIFKLAPNFHQCTIHSDVDFDRCQFLDVRSKNAVRYYRALKLAMGLQRSTAEEAKFYALEQRSRFYHPDTRFNEIIVSFIYSLTSDYGRSIIRPVLVLLGITIFFFGLYLFETFRINDFVSPSNFWTNFAETLQFTISQVVKPFNVWSKTGIETIIQIAGRECVLTLQLQSLMQSLLTIIPVTLFILAIRRRFRMS